MEKAKGIRKTTYFKEPANAPVQTNSQSGMGGGVSGSAMKSIGRNMARAANQRGKK